MKKKYTPQYEKYRKTMMSRYGVDSNFKMLLKDNAKKIWDENYDQIISKRKSTCLKKYGVEYHTQSDDVKQKSKQTLIDHYGSVKESYNKRVKKIQASKLERYGSSTYHNVEQFKETLSKRHADFETNNNCTRYTTLLKQYGQGWKVLNLPIIYNGRVRYISNIYIDEIKRYKEENQNLKATSKLEQEIYNFVKDHTPYRCYRNAQNQISDDKQRYELDIYIPKLKIAIEFNGDYWHSDLHKDKYYHQNKTKLCYEKGILLVHIYEHDYKNHKQEIQENLIKLLNGEDCSFCGWIPVNKYNEYYLTDPNLITINESKILTLNIYDEGTFTKKIKH